MRFVRSVLCAVVICAPLFSGPVMSKDTAAAEAPKDAWTEIENDQLGLAMAKILNDDAEKTLQTAAQKRFGLDDDGGERFMVCIMGLAGHPDFTVAHVSEALAICEKNMAPARN